MPGGGPADPGDRRAWRLGVPPLVWSLGVVSLLADLASEFAYPLVPIFLTATLGASPAVLGLIEGLAEATAAALRPITGRLSDRMARRRPFVSLGYGLSAVGRALLPLAPGWGLVLAARLVDRTGKGVRSAPRDAMIADATPSDIRGRAFGLHRTMDTLGAIGGPLMALAALAVIGQDHLREVLMVAAIPAVAAVAVTFMVREPARRARARTPEAPHAGIRRLPGRYWAVLTGWTLFAIGNSSDAFLILRAEDVLGSIAAAVGCYVLFNVVTAAASFPAGVASDRLGRRPLMVAGLGVFAAVYVAMAAAPAAWVVVVAFAVYGGYMALTDGVGRALVTDLSPPDAVGVAMGVFQGVTAVAVLVASVAGGLLWERLGPGWTFGYGAVCAVLGAAVLLLTPSDRPRRVLTPAPAPSAP